MKLQIIVAVASTLALVGLQSSAEARSGHGHGFRHHGSHHGHHGTRSHGGRHGAERVRGGGASGLASWYGPGFQGHRTASGERFNSNGLTAAHRSLPLGCRVLVTNRANGRSVVVRINDRGPFGTGKVIDLSHASARAIGMSGSAPVSLSRL